MHRKQGLFLSVYVDDIKMAGRKQNPQSYERNLVTLFDLGEPTRVLGMHST